MIWLNPLAWIGLIALGVPILVHILVQRRAEPFAFPSLRFIQPTRLAAIRRHVLEDLPLLTVRAGILAAAVGALAGPLLLTSARRHAWNARTVRAVVVDGANVRAESDAFRSQTFVTPDLRDGVRRATAWLESAPPARRELLVSAPFAMGSITQADLGALRPEVGIRFVRSGTLPTARSFAGTPVLSADPHRSAGVEVRDRTIELNGASTIVRESAGSPSMVPIEIVAPPEGRKAAQAALTAVLSQRVFAPLPGRTARVVFAGSPQFDRAATLVPPTEPWIADAIARIIGDHDLEAVNADGTPSIAATGDGPVLVVRTSAPATATVTLRLLRTVLNALAHPSGTVLRPSPTVVTPPVVGNARQSQVVGDARQVPVVGESRESPVGGDVRQSPVGGDARQSPVGGDVRESPVGGDVRQFPVVGDASQSPVVGDAHQSLVVGDALQGVPNEILPIPDEQLRAWERPAGEVRTPRLDTLEGDDRRWWWAAALLLLTLEARMRRALPARNGAHASQEAARVA